jgi:hypothetical protein
MHAKGTNETVGRLCNSGETRRQRLHPENILHKATQVCIVRRLTKKSWFDTDGAAADNKPDQSESHDDECQPYARRPRLFCLLAPAAPCDTAIFSQSYYLIVPNVAPCRLKERLRKQV